MAALIAIALAADTAKLTVGLIIGVVLWLIAIGFTRRAYVHQFRATLEAREIQRDVRVPTLDGTSVDVLMAALASPEEAEAAAALDLLATREDGVPALVFYHPSPGVVRRALGSLRTERRPDVARVLQHLVRHGDPQVRAAAIVAASRCGQTSPVAGLQDVELDVRAATAVVLCDGPHAAQARVVIGALLQGSTDMRLALARAIAHQPCERFRELLASLIVRRESEVVCEVLHIWQQVPALADEERLVALLANSHVRGETRRALLAIGSLDRLIAALESPRTPLEIRRHLPQTINRFRSPVAAAALATQLVREPDGTTEFKILRALGRMRADDPRLPVAAAPLRRYIARSLADAARYRELRIAVAPHSSPTLDLLAQLLSEKRRHAIERVFRALGVLYPRAGMHSLHDAIASGDDERASAAREILDEAIPADLRTPVIDELDVRAQSSTPFPSTDAALRTLLSDPSDSLRCIAAHHVAQSRLVELRDELVRLKPVTGSRLVTLAFDQAIASLHA